MAVTAQTMAWIKDRANWRDLAQFAVVVVRRFTHDRGLQTASALTYTSLLSIVPLLVVSLAILSGFGAFAEMKEAVKTAILDALLPSTKTQAAEHIDQFLGNAKALTGPGLAGIAVTALMLLSTIEGTFNRIWRVKSPRSLTIRILRYWSALTMGPLLLGASLSLTSYFFAVADDKMVRGAMQQIGHLIPLALQWVAFTLLYITIPNAPVRLKHAVIGGLVAAALFEALKNGFAIYIDNADNFRVIYGALAVIPIFLMWLYSSWTVILIGAEVAAAVPEWREALARGGSATDTDTATARLETALALLCALWKAAGKGESVDPNAPEAIQAGWADDGLRTLVGAGFVTIAADERLVAGRDYARTPAWDLWQALDLGMPQIDPNPELIRRLRLHEVEALQTPLSTILDEIGEQMAMNAN
jgi:membrane protein